MKIRPVGAQLFHAARHNEATVFCRNFANALKNAASGIPEKNN